MKKLVFTAIAMIAFCGASMANTKEVKRINPINKKLTKVLYVRTVCDELWVASYEYAAYVLGYQAGRSGAWGWADGHSSAYGC